MKKQPMDAVAAIVELIQSNFTQEQVIEHMKFIMEKAPAAAPAVRSMLAPKLGLTSADLQT